MQLRTSVQNESMVLELTTSNGRIALGGVAGTITLTITAADMATLLPLKYVYDLELITGTVVTRLVQGTFTVRPEVTR
jgi:tRNA threonylcarbamoyladenosine modification (KEOPS) complex  Pcc1 subunit